MLKTHKMTLVSNTHQYAWDMTALNMKCQNANVISPYKYGYAITLNRLSIVYCQTSLLQYFSSTYFLFVYCSKSVYYLVYTSFHQHFLQLILVTEFYKRGLKLLGNSGCKTLFICRCCQIFLKKCSTFWESVLINGDGRALYRALCQRYLMQVLPAMANVLFPFLLKSQELNSYVPERYYSR